MRIGPDDRHVSRRSPLALASSGKQDTLRLYAKGENKLSLPSLDRNRKFIVFSNLAKEIGAVSETTFVGCRQATMSMIGQN